MKPSYYNNRSRLCGCCCNVFPDAPEYPNCPHCLTEGGILINEDNRIVLQYRHLVFNDPIPTIGWEALSDMIKKEKTNKPRKFKKTIKRLSRYINPIRKNKRVDKRKQNNNPKS